MALYVAVCLLAVLTTLADRPHDDHVRIIGIIWGTTIGLVIAHLFAFRISARLIGYGRVTREDAESAGAQLAGGATVAVLATVPVLLLPAPAELEVTRFVLTGFIAAVAYAVARRAGAGVGRALGYASAVVVIAGVVVALKNGLVGH